MRDTVKKELKEKYEVQAEKFKGKLYIGLKEVGNISKYFESKGTFGHAIYVPEAKQAIIDKEGDEQYDIIHLLVRNKSLILRMLGLKNKYVLLSKEDDKGNTIVTIDPLTKSVILPSNFDIFRYADTWHNSRKTVEYVNNISIKAMIEEVWTHLESTPDKVAHMEQEQAKLERTARIYSESERMKWDERKKSGDTTIT